MNQELLNKIIDAGPVHLGDNPSTHSPIMIKHRVPNVPLSKILQPDILPVKKPAWYKATQADKDQYTALLAQNLQQLDSPDSLLCGDVHCQCEAHTNERDSHVLDILCTIVETSHECIPLSSRHSRIRGRTWQSLPGWTQNIAPLKQDSLFWHSVWISAGRPPSGSLHQFMVHTRLKYHSAVKAAKRAAANLRENSQQQAKGSRSS